MMDKFYRELLTVKSVGSKYVKPWNEFVSPHIVREIHKLLRNAFNQAVKWELMTRNPVEHATLPKEEHTPRDIWTVEVLFKALDACEDDNRSISGIRMRSRRFSGRNTRITVWYLPQQMADRWRSDCRNIKWRRNQSSIHWLDQMAWYRVSSELVVSQNSAVRLKRSLGKSSLS